MLADAPPPSNLNAEHVGEGHIRVTWTPVTDSNWEGYRIYYKLEPDGDENVFQNVDDHDAEETTIEVTVGGTYSITILTRTEFLPSEVEGPVTLIVGKQDLAYITEIQDNLLNRGWFLHPWSRSH